ncbi:MAG: glycosyltransferase [Lentisphaerae bacterium]|nr:glycosyltransferase [Lentisphaerota bacterium]
MNISVVTTVYNRPEHFRLMLASLAVQSRRPDELVVADDGSDEAAAAALNALLATAPFPVKMVRQEKDGYRLAAARNRAIRAATGDYLLFLDCDIALLPDALAIHERHAAARRLLCGHRGLLDDAATRALFAAGPAPAREDWEQAWSQADKTELADAARLFRRQALLRRWHAARPHKPKLLGCHFSLFREDVERINGFDENFVGWGYEDDDFARRLYKAGAAPRSVIEDARALHLWHPSLAPQELKRHRDRPNRAYFRRWRVPARCLNGLEKPET